MDNLHKHDAPIICIDGPAGVGKGTVALNLAEKLDWHLLDSGSLYRIVGLITHRRQIDFDDAEQIAAMAQSLDIRFTETGGQVQTIVDGENLSEAIRTEKCGGFASQVAQHQPVRDALYDVQRHFQQAPGLVADGRDMGTQIFPDAPCKIFLTASAEIRAQRRYKQLNEKGIDANLRALLAEINQRDERDKNRKVAPLLPAEDAYVLDTSALSITEVMRAVAQYVGKQYPTQLGLLDDFL